MVRNGRETAVAQHRCSSLGMPHPWLNLSPSAKEVVIERVLLSYLPRRPNRRRQKLTPLPSTGICFLLRAPKEGGRSWYATF